jgi:hypothetical protein
MKHLIRVILLSVMATGIAITIFSATGCKTTERIGCSPKDQRLSLRDAKRSQARCERTFLEYVNQQYPVDTLSDKIVTEYVKGETIVKERLVYTNCDSIMQAAKKDPSLNTSKVPVKGTETNRTDTIKALREIVKEDGKKLALYSLKAEEAKAKADSIAKEFSAYKSNAEKKIAIQRGKLTTLYWLIGATLGILGIGAAAKYFKLKLF